MSNQPESARNVVEQAKDTFESILIALILAFIFRAFIIEAFIIPTGSMAPSLYGAHIDHLCSNCGYTFAVGLGTVPNIVKCPNCEWQDNIEDRPPLPETGDRILVLKWPFAMGGPLAPKRWDVVVFKAPFASANSNERDGQTNYIKRLIGLPDEVIELVDGDVYTAQAQAVPDEIRDKLLARPLPTPLTAEEQQELDSILQIAHKTADAQDVLWQIVYNMDFPPEQIDLGITPAWTPLIRESSWAVGKRMMSVSARAGQPQFVQLEGKSFRDDYGYNNGGGQRIVSDLQLGTTVIWHGGGGTILLQLSKRDELYTMELSPHEGTGRVVRAPLDGSRAPQTIGSPWTFRPWRFNWPVQLAFANVDHQLQVWMDGRLLWQSPPDAFPTSAAAVKRRPYESRAPIVRIGAADLQADLRHTAVYRDVYYRDAEKISVHNSMGQPTLSSYTGQPGWGTRDNPMLLRHNEYFVLGDNSPQSLDSRVWWQVGEHLAGRDYRVGTVPADQMIGQAFFVYWPSGYRLLGHGLPIVPNVGRMRWIR